MSDSGDGLEITLNGKRYMISLKPLHDEVKDELRAVFDKEIDSLHILKLYITKAQEYALMCQSIEKLCTYIESAATTQAQETVQIRPIS